MSENRRKKSVVLKGEFRIETEVYNKFSGEITFRADVVDGKTETEYVGIPILRLIIDLMDGGAINDQGDMDTEVYVEDEFFHQIPYLKPVRAFRNALETELIHLASNPSQVISLGAEKYLEEIRTFSELKGLVRQAKTCVNTLKPERKGAERMARAIMEAMNVIPATDTEFKRE